MGSSGHAFIAHTKALSPPAQNKDGGYGPPPHPLAIRPGQRFWPLAGKRRRPFAVRSVDTATGVVEGRRLDGAGEHVRVTLKRLLATDGDDGAHYRFFGFMPRRYSTWACVAARDGEVATLVLPEWHPARPVRFLARLLPRDGRAVGSWLRCTADLSEPRAERLGVVVVEAVPDPGSEQCHRPAWTPAERPSERIPTVRDIVLELATGDLSAFHRRGGLLDVYVHERPEHLGAGDRVYLARAGADAIADYLTVRKLEPRPMGTCIRCDPEPQAMRAPVPVGSDRRAQHWRRRWWS